MILRRVLAAVPQSCLLLVVIIGGGLSPLFFASGWVVPAPQRQPQPLRSPLSRWNPSVSSSSYSSGITTELAGVRGPDIDVVFGSTNDTGVSYGDDDDDEADAAQEQEQRAHRVQELLRESDDEYKRQRRNKKWGKFANITSPTELAELVAEEKSRIQAQHEAKAAIAQASGISYQVLEPKETSTIGESGGAFLETEDGKSRISIGSAAQSKSWFSEMDEDLREEWQALTGDSEAAMDVVSSDSSSEKSSMGGGKSGSSTMVSRDALAGVRVGSAGGWTLEVFPGDFVVHRKFGIGRFERTCLRSKTKLTPEECQARDERRAEILAAECRKRQKNKGGITPDEIQEIRSKFGTEEDTDPISNPQTTVLEITYTDAVVHVPVDRAYRLSRYRAGDAVIKPKLSRVKGDAWSRAKRKVEENTLQLAADVLALYATRETLQRAPFDPSLEASVAEFEETFPFEPTPDQKKCFEDVENDMVWRSRPMDRLICGDVGFGKTEVAFRAIFRAIANGRQAAMLAPTGVLAAQHYKNLMERMGPDTPFNVSIAFLRGGSGRTSKASLEMRQQIANGDFQLIVGTHAMLQNDVRYKDIGLLVIDEEQRFGVKQKERLKVICNGVDVLTLTATPIPRTLQMSLSGIRDTSTIRSPPPMRKATITYVQDVNEDIVSFAIGQELERGGQIFYVVPRIAMLEEAEKMIRRLFPDTRIIKAHGRMHRNGAEENVAAFAEGDYDVLLATTVIENGVDIPTVNTIIVQDSQKFGMSTLYQLRGRVGRSDLQAYAFFLHREESITEQAAMRLQAIGELSELGSGFDVANRDLEIRGAGSLLGTEQSGMAARVGFDVYMRMLKKSIRKLSGLDLPLVPRTNVLLPTRGCSPDTFTIPPAFISDDEERKKEETKARLAGSTAKLVNITHEWKDTYGPLHAELQSQLKVMHLHACTRRLGIDLVGLTPAATEDDADRMDCVLRSPGLRPRHWASIARLLSPPASKQSSKAAASSNVVRTPKGLNVFFPGRLTRSGQEVEIVGGRKVDLQALSFDDETGSGFGSGVDDDDDWDALDQEEMEAMNEISSAVKVKSIDEINIKEYPHFVVPNVVQSKVVDQLLKALLPVAKVVYEQQEKDKSQAVEEAQLRENQQQELLRQRKQKAARSHQYY